MTGSALATMSQFGVVSRAVTAPNWDTYRAELGHVPVGQRAGLEREGTAA